MKSERDSIASDVEDLADGPDKEALREAIGQLDQVEKEIKRLDAKERGLSSKPLDRIFSILCICGLSYFFVAGIYHGRFINFFGKQMQYAYREDEPYIFWFIAIFVGALALVFLCLALGITRIGGPTSRSTRSRVKRAPR
jgi:hypothetical protein